ncbi:MAG: hypothetical protein KN64_02185 [Sulfurovum sp. AS07-7]|nr:MAG: hypothetical protein KN64_02185 [Sulfurovum sp. AS07-7]
MLKLGLKISYKKEKGTFMLIDTHCHLDKPRYKYIIQNILQNAQNNRVNGILIASTQNRTLDEAKLLSENHRGIFYSVGYHPKYAEIFDKSVLEEHITHERCIAVGEFGLDYSSLSRKYEKKQPVLQKQQDVLVEHLEFAVQHQKPVLIHLRDKRSRKYAHDDFLEIVKPYLGRLVGGVIHAMNFDKEEFIALSEYNFYFGIGGQISYDIKALKDFVKKAPLSHLVLETDAPWLTPTSRKEENEKTSNEPAFLVDVLKELAKTLKMDSSALEEILLQNTLKLFPAFSEIVDNQEGYGV